MLHTENHINSTADYLQLLLKVLSMFKISIRYNETIVQYNVPYYVVIMFINCGKTIGCSLENHPIKDFISTFVRNMVF